MSVHIVPVVRDTEGKRSRDHYESLTDDRAKKQALDEQMRRLAEMHMTFGKCVPLETSELQQVTLEFLRGVRVSPSGSSQLIYTGTTADNTQQTVVYNKETEISRGTYGAVYRYKLDTVTQTNSASGSSRILPFLIKIWKKTFSKKKNEEQSFQPPKFLALKKFLGDADTFADNERYIRQKKFSEVVPLEVDKEKFILDTFEKHNDACAKLRIAAVPLNPLGSNDPKYILMENMDGSLDNFEHQCTAARTLQILNGVAHAVACFRNSGFMYTDLKPANILYRCEANMYHVYLGDFGSAFVNQQTKLSVYTFPPPLAWPDDWYVKFPTDFTFGFFPAQEWHLVYLISFLAFLLWENSLVGQTSEMIMTNLRYTYDPDVYTSWDQVLLICAEFEKDKEFKKWNNLTESAWIDSNPKEPFQRAVYYYNKYNKRSTVLVKTLMKFTGFGISSSKNPFSAEKCRQIDEYVDTNIKENIESALQVANIDDDERKLLTALEYGVHARTNGATIEKLIQMFN